MIDERDADCPDCRYPVVWGECRCHDDGSAPRPPHKEHDTTPSSQRGVAKLTPSNK